MPHPTSFYHMIGSFSSLVGAPLVGAHKRTSHNVQITSKIHHK